jgi:hypothetical protein
MNVITPASKQVKGCIPGLTRNPAPSWIMNIKLRFPASAGMTVLIYRVARAIMPTGDPYPVRAKIAKGNQYKMQGDAARRERMSAALPPAQKTGPSEEQKRDHSFAAKPNRSIRIDTGEFAGC